MLAIRDLAAKTLDGTVPTVKQANRMSDDELVERLITVRGIGRWTFEMLLMFRLGRTDVFPVDDYGDREVARMRRAGRFAEAQRVDGLRRALASLSQRGQLGTMWRAADMKDLPLAGTAVAEKPSGKE